MFEQVTLSEVTNATLLLSYKEQLSDLQQTYKFRYQTDKEQTSDLQRADIRARLKRKHVLGGHDNAADTNTDERAHPNISPMFSCSLR